MRSWSWTTWFWFWLMPRLSRGASPSTRCTVLVRILVSATVHSFYSSQTLLTPIFTAQSQSTLRACTFTHWVRQEYKSSERGDLPQAGCGGVGVGWLSGIPPGGGVAHHIIHTSHLCPQSDTTRHDTTRHSSRHRYNTAHAEGDTGDEIVIVTLRRLKGPRTRTD
jgi:hypothetical protein